MLRATLINIWRIVNDKRFQHVSRNEKKMIFVMSVTVDNSKYARLEAAKIRIGT